MKLSINKKTNPTETKRKGKKVENKTITIAAMSIIAAGAAFLFLLNMEKNIARQYETGEVVQTFTEVPAGVVINEENVSKYFEVVDMEKNIIPETSFTTLDELIGLSPKIDLSNKVKVTSSMFSELGELEKEIGNPVSISFIAPELAQTVSGTLRTGDYINIYVSEEDEVTEKIYYKTKNVWQKVYIKEAYDSSGTLIANSDTDSKATMFTVIINKNDVEDFYTELYDTTMQIIKVTDLVNAGSFEKTSSNTKFFSDDLENDTENSSEMAENEEELEVMEYPDIEMDYSLESPEVSVEEVGNEVVAEMTGETTEENLTEPVTTE